MIEIGLAGWGDHDTLYSEPGAARNKLNTYSKHFPIVEVDSSFYAIQSTKNYEKWTSDTPEHFSFVVKAYQGMTGHTRGKIPYESTREMFDAFLKSIQPLKEWGKLQMVLFQYPPWFDCTKENVQILRYTKALMKDIPAALEFRHQSWYTDEMSERTLSFMRQEGWIHSICDEPQAGQGSIPIVLHPTHSDMTLVRFHGRNVSGWNSSGQTNWREVRYLYQYSEAELLEWKAHLEKLSTMTRRIAVIFNNNSGGHAAGNAKQLARLLGLKGYDGGGEQLVLF